MRSGVAIEKPYFRLIEVVLLACAVMISIHFPVVEGFRLEMDRDVVRWCRLVAAANHCGG